MLLRKQGFPEEGELVLCTVTSVQYHSVIADLDEYGKSGLIHISEVAPGRIRNIRDFVKEGKKVVCKVLRINQEKGYIDLSLRRVNESEKRRKIDEIKRGQNAEKIVEIAAGKLGLKTEALFEEIIKKAHNYNSLYEFFDAISKDPSLLEQAGIDKKQAKVLEEIIQLRIKPTEIEVQGKLKATIYAPNGVDIIKESLKQANEAAKGRVSIHYLGSGTYHFIVKAPEYKEAEKLIKAATDSAVAIIAKHGGTAEFTREQSK